MIDLTVLGPNTKGRKRRIETGKRKMIELTGHHRKEGREES